MTTTLSAPAAIRRLRERLPRLAPLLAGDPVIGSLGLDSLDTVELLCAIHEEFGIRLAEHEFQPDQRLSDLAQTIATKTPKP